jgi:hypothetical protein
LSYNKLFYLSLPNKKTNFAECVIKSEGSKFFVKLLHRNTLYTLQGAFSKRLRFFHSFHPPALSTPPFVTLCSVSLCRCLSFAFSVSHFLSVSVSSFTFAHSVRLFPLCLALSFSGSYVHVWCGRRTNKYVMMRHTWTDQLCGRSKTAMQWPDRGEKRQLASLRPPDLCYWCY